LTSPNLPADSPILDRLRDMFPPEAREGHAAAWDPLQRTAADPNATSAPHECLPHLASALLATANPERALLGLERLSAGMGGPGALYRVLAGRPRLVGTLVTLFAGSRFLTEIVLRNPASLESLSDYPATACPRDAGLIYDQAMASLGASRTYEERLDALRRYQRHQLLRIGTCDLMCLSDLFTVTAQLSHLADGLIRAALQVAADEIGAAPQDLAVVAMGKLGGQELNYSSDIDLIFLTTTDPARQTPLARRLIDALARVTGEGFLYRVDMRLRPWGSVGPLISSLDGYLAYLERSARPWERQALLKARVITGDEALRRTFLVSTNGLLFAPGADPRVEVRAIKQRIEAQLDANGEAWGQVKLGRGSIRDVEFVTQYLQLRHGAQHPDLRSANTLAALAQLQAHGVLASDDYRVLVEGYTFLRPVEHSLQMMDHRQTHRLPGDARGIQFLARRLGFEGDGAGVEFLARYYQHTAAIRATYEHHLLSEGRPMAQDEDTPAAPDIRQHVQRMAPSYRATFSDEEILRHAEMAERIDDAHPVEVDAAPMGDGSWRVTIVGYDYAGELSLICGLLFVYGFSIGDGYVFTYEAADGQARGLASDAAIAQPGAGTRSPIAGTGSAGPQEPPPSPVWGPRTRRRTAGPRAATPHDGRRKIVDVFSVRPVVGEAPPDLWPFYEDDLTGLLQLLQRGQQREAHGELAKRVALAIGDAPAASTTLQPIDIGIDNDASDRYTVLRIDASDTPGFLYEFTSALALGGVYIAQVIVDSVGNRVRDTLYLTDSRGAKIAAPGKQRELRATTVLVKHFAHLLPHSPNPESALLHFRELLGQLLTRPDWPNELASLERPEVLSALARLLGVSDFLWDDFLRMQHANLYPLVRDLDALTEAKSKERLYEELRATLQGAEGLEQQRDALNAFKDREMFRIDMRHIQGQIVEFGQFAAELTDLAEVVVDMGTRLCVDRLTTAYGAPLLEDGRPCPLSVLALGKCGGRELGYASDIELMFVFEANGRTAGPNVISTAEFFEKVVIAFLDLIRAKRKGIFEIDLRLRPYGSAGSMAVAFESFRHYYAPEGPAWPYERQALIKLRPIAGDPTLGARVAALRDQYVFGGSPFDVTAMRAMRERQVRHLVMGGTFNAKFGNGGLVDCEYLVQGMQINHGRANPALRVNNTSEAIEALAQAGVLTPEDHERLKAAYTFLRRLIDALRMVRGDAKDLTTPAADMEEYAFLARRLSYGAEVARLRADMDRHSQAVQELSRKLLG
jgi:[glutamine synthetase] adenylyltransferase / [glutamine synthetase]-adenylyl-L-tyrosine phosphorylase